MLLSPCGPWNSHWSAFDVFCISLFGIHRFFVSTLKITKYFLKFSSSFDLVDVIHYNRYLYRYALWMLSSSEVLIYFSIDSYQPLYNFCYKLEEFISYDFLSFHSVKFNNLNKYINTPEIINDFVRFRFCPEKICCLEMNIKSNNFFK